MPQRDRLEWILTRSIMLGLCLLPCIPLLVTSSLVYPAVTGKAFAFRIVTEVVFGLWLVLATYAPAYRLRVSPILLAGGFWLFVAGLANLQGVDPYRSFWSTAERMDGYVTLLHVGALVLVAGSTLSRASWKRVLGIAVAVSTLVAAVAGLESLFQNAVGNSSHRAMSTLGNPAYLAAYLLLQTFLACYLIAAYPGRRRRDVVLGLAVVLHVAVLPLTGTRGAMVGLIGGSSVTLAIVAFGRLGKVARRATVVVSMVLVAVLGVGAWAQLQGLVPATVPEGNAPQQTGLSQGRASDVVVAERQDLGQLRRLAIAEASISNGLNQRLFAWGVAIDAIFERPWRGWGQDTFEIAVERHYDARLYGSAVFDRPHNSFIEWGVAAGIPGVLSYVGVFCAALLVCWQLGRGGAVVPGGILAGWLVAFALNNSFLFDTPAATLMFGLLLAYLHSQSARSQKETNSALGSRRMAAVVGVLAMAGVVGAVALGSAPGIRALSLWRAADARSDVPWPDKAAALDRALAEDSFAGEELRRAYLELASAALQSRIADSVCREIVASAAAGMEELIIAAPERSRHYEDLGRFLVSSGRAEEGVAMLLRAVERIPAKPATRFALAEAFDRSGRPVLALDAARIGFETEPRHDWSRLYYSALAHFHGETDLGVRLLRPSASDPMPEARISGLLPDAVGEADFRAADQRWLATLLDFNARRRAHGSTSGQLRGLAESIPLLAARRRVFVGLARGVEDQLLERELRASAAGGP